MTRDDRASGSRPPHVRRPGERRTRRSARETAGRWMRDAAARYFAMRKSALNDTLSCMVQKPINGDVPGAATLL